MNPGIASLEGKAALSVCGFGFELEASLVTWQTQTAEPDVPKCLEVHGLWPLRLPFAPAIFCRLSSEGVSSRRGHSILMQGRLWAGHEPFTQPLGSFPQMDGQLPSICLWVPRTPFLVHFQMM